MSPIESSVIKMSFYKSIAMQNIVYFGGISIWNHDPDLETLQIHNFQGWTSVPSKLRLDIKTKNDIITRNNGAKLTKPYI